MLQDQHSFANGRQADEPDKLGTTNFGGGERFPFTFGDSAPAIDGERLERLGRERREGVGRSSGLRSTDCSRLGENWAKVYDELSARNVRTEQMNSRPSRSRLAEQP